MAYAKVKFVSGKVVYLENVKQKAGFITGYQITKDLEPVLDKKTGGDILHVIQKEAVKYIKPQVADKLYGELQDEASA